MVNKPMPSLRSGPSAVAAASFVEGTAAALHIAEAFVESPSTAQKNLIQPGAGDVAVHTKTAKKTPAEKRRMTIYLSKGNAKKLALRSVHEEKDMSDIVEEALNIFFEKTK